MKPVQFFSSEYLQACKEAKVDFILQFLDDFRRLHLLEQPLKGQQHQLLGLAQAQPLECSSLGSRQQEEAASSACRLPSSV